MKAGISLLILGIVGLGCASPTPVPASDFAVSEASTQGQMLEIGATAVINKEKIDLEVAQTSQQQALGLMYREALPPNRGMLFSFDTPRFTRFWMKNVKIPLDMLFLLNGEVKAIAASVPPCQTTPCPTYGPQTPIDQVIELPGGRAAQLGLKVGDRITIDF